MTEISAMPAALAEEAARNPIEVVALRAKERLRAATPALASDLQLFPVAVFGLTSGFFYLTAAQGRAWGMSEDHVTALLTIQALGHFHFAFHDAVIDDGTGSAVMCLLSDAALLCYLDGLTALSECASPKYAQFHRNYYDLYAAAIARDLAHRDRLFGYQADDILGLGDKAAPGATMWHLVADLSGHPDQAEPAARAVLRMCTGLQLVDDLNDCADDAAGRNWTWPVTSALLAYPGVNTGDRDAVEAAVVGSGAAAGCLRLAIQAFADARDLARSAGASAITDLAAMWQERTSDRARILAHALTAT